MVSSFRYDSLRVAFFGIAEKITKIGTNFVVFADRADLKIAEILRTSANRYVVYFARSTGICSCVYGTFKECIQPVIEFFGKKVLQDLDNTFECDNKLQKIITNVGDM